MQSRPFVRGAGRLLCAGVVFGLAGTASAQVVGPGTNLAGNDGADTAGGRINLDTSTPQTLQPGTYTASLFNFDAGAAGDVTPFLATDNGNGTYTAIAVGATQAVAGAAQDQSVPFGGTATFTLAAPTQVFAGITSQQQNPIILDDGVCCTDHEGVGQGGYTVTVGGTVPPDGGFSNPDLGRVYAFSIEVIPEPTSLGLLSVGALGLLGRRRRR